MLNVSFSQLPEVTKVTSEVKVSAGRVLGVITLGDPREAGPDMTIMATGPEGVAFFEEIAREAAHVAAKLRLHTRMAMA